MENYLIILRFAVSSPRLFSKILQIKKLKLTYLSLPKLVNLSCCVKDIERNNIPGVLIEAGCALGGSAIVISFNKAEKRALKIYDTFAQIPPPTAKDEPDAVQRYQQISNGEAKGIQNDQYYGYEENLLEKVINNFKKFGLSPEKDRIIFNQGLFEDVLKISEPVALAHIDSDWYDSIMTSLKRITPMLSRNGLIIIDDYNDWRGAKKAVDDYFKEKLNDYQFTYGPQLVIKKLV